MCDLACNYPSTLHQWNTGCMLTLSSESWGDGFYHRLAQDSSADATATQIMLVPAESAWLILPE